MIMTVYQNTIIVYLGPFFLFFSCALNLANEEVAVPTACNVTTTCVNASNRTGMGQRLAPKTNGGMIQKLAVQQIDAVVYKGPSQVSKEPKQYPEQA